MRNGTAASCDSSGTEDDNADTQTESEDGEKSKDETVINTTSAGQNSGGHEEEKKTNGCNENTEVRVFFRLTWLVGSFIFY